MGRKNHNRKIGTKIRIRIHFGPGSGSTIQRWIRGSTLARIHYFQRRFRGSGSESTFPERGIRGSGSSIPKYGSRDPDPRQNEIRNAGRYMVSLNNEVKHLFSLSNHLSSANQSYLRK